MEGKTQDHTSIRRKHEETSFYLTQLKSGYRLLKKVQIEQQKENQQRTEKMCELKNDVTAVFGFLNVNLYAFSLEL